jgi:hypothetical protein
MSCVGFYDNDPQMSGPRGFSVYGQGLGIADEHGLPRSDDQAISVAQAAS